MLRGLGIFTIALGFMGVGLGFFGGADDVVEPFPEYMVARGMSELYRSSQADTAEFELLRTMTGTVGIELFLRGTLSLKLNSGFVGLICLFHGASCRNMYWVLCFFAGNKWLISRRFRGLLALHKSI